MRRDLLYRQPDPDKKDRTAVKRESVRRRLNEDRLNDGTPLRSTTEYEQESELDSPSGEYRRSVTNHDEQLKTTNTDDSPLGEKEAEGL